MHRENVCDNFSFLSQSPKSSVRQRSKETCQSNFGASIKIPNSLHLFFRRRKTRVGNQESGLRHDFKSTLDTYHRLQII